MTAAAVSQQIKQLEEGLGVRLFDRGPRGLALTAAGHDYLPACQQVLQQLAEATRRVRNAGRPAPIVLSCTVSFAMQWLLPRLDAFQSGHPDLDLQISTSNRLVDFRDDSVQFAIRHGLGRYEGLTAECLLDDELIPVCAPTLPARPADFRPADLAALPLLHDEGRDDWRLWLAGAGLADIDWTRGPVFTDSNGAVEAALAGKGVALLRRSFVAAALADGRLLAMPDHPMQSRLAYYLVYPPHTLNDPACRKFRNWLLTQPAQSNAPPPGLPGNEAAATP